VSLVSAATTKQRFTDCSKKNPRPEPRNGWRHSRSRISRRNPRLQPQSWRRWLRTPTGDLLFLFLWFVGLMCGGVLLVTFKGGS
jgi:hypothetical protein